MFTSIAARKERSGHVDLEGRLPHDAKIPAVDATAAMSFTSPRSSQRCAPGLKIAGPNIDCLRVSRLPGEVLDAVIGFSLQEVSRSKFADCGAPRFGWNVTIQSRLSSSLSAAIVVSG